VGRLGFSCTPIPGCTSTDAVAASSLICLRISAAYCLLVSFATGLSMKFGSPSSVLRSSYAWRIASVM
jgi:hypothetical protein